MYQHHRATAVGQASQEGDAVLRIDHHIRPDAAQRAQPDAVLTDNSLPGMSGHDLLRSLDDTTLTASPDWF